jgi:hypothetical protein
VRVTTGAAAAFLLAVASPSFGQDQGSGGRSAQEYSRTLSEIRRDFPQISLPASDSIPSGSRSIPAGARVGSITVRDGDVEILGAVDGDVVAIDGNITVAEGGQVNGDVLAIRGQTRIAGVVTGSILRLEGDLGAVPSARPEAVGGTWRPLGVTLGTLGMLLVLGIGVLIFAGSTLDSVVEVMEHQLGRAFLIGIVGELGLVPMLLLLIVGLALTVLGILLIPFAVVAYALAAAGTLTLGFLAVAVVVGGAIAKRRGSRPLSARATSLRALMIGVLSLMFLWMVAAAMIWSPLAAAILRLIAAAVTWVAITAGFGAVILSRVSARRVDVRPEPVVPLDDLSWQTPTPVSGVAAARRPTPVVTSGRGR